MRKTHSRLAALVLSILMLMTVMAPAASAEYVSAYDSKQAALEAGLALNL